MVGVTSGDWVVFSIARDEALQLVELLSGFTRVDGHLVPPADWERLNWFALASGAFPVAWLPVRLHRLAQDYPAPWENTVPESDIGLPVGHE
jgi:hypothetical protein